MVNVFANLKTGPVINQSVKQLLEEIHSYLFFSDVIAVNQDKLGRMGRRVLLVRNSYLQLFRVLVMSC